MNWRSELLNEIAETDDPLAFIQEVRELLHAHSPLKAQPVDYVRWVPIEQVVANDYNPNKVSGPEMRLLKHSIDCDGYTQPIVTVRESELRYVVVDGFHRCIICRTDPEIRARNKGRIPIVVVDADMRDRMASTVRHNRARGRHTIEGMSSLVFDMLDQGYTDTAVCNELGMEPEELLRLKHITGFSKLFENSKYSKEWRYRSQVLLEQKWKKNKEAGSPS